MNNTHNTTYLYVNSSPNRVIWSPLTPIRTTAVLVEEPDTRGGVTHVTLDASLLTATRQNGFDLPLPLKVNKHPTTCESSELST